MTTNYENMINAMNLYTSHRLNRMAECIREAKGVINNHTDQLEKVDGLIMTIDGNICPVLRGSMVCTNPVKIAQKDDMPHWSTWSCAGPNVVWTNASEPLEKVVNRINAELARNENWVCPPIIGFVEINYEKE